MFSPSPWGWFFLSRLVAQIKVFHDVGVSQDSNNRIGRSSSFIYVWAVAICKKRGRVSSATRGGAGQWLSWGFGNQSSWGLVAALRRRVVWRGVGVST